MQMHEDRFGFGGRRRYSSRCRSLRELLVQRYQFFANLLCQPQIIRVISGQAGRGGEIQGRVVIDAKFLDPKSSA